MYGNMGVFSKVGAEEAFPLIQAAAGCGGRVLRIQGKQNHFIAVRRAELGDCFAGEWVPVAHGHKTAGVQAAPRQLGFERNRLPLREVPDGRASADGGVVVLHFAGARGRNQA